MDLDLMRNGSVESVIETDKGELWICTLNQKRIYWIWIYRGISRGRRRGVDLKHTEKSETCPDFRVEEQCAD